MAYTLKKDDDDNDDDDLAKVGKAYLLPSEPQSVDMQ
jgi:hypothetical protein